MVFAEFCVPRLGYQRKQLCKARLTWASWIVTFTCQPLVTRAFMSLQYVGLRSDNPFLYVGLTGIMDGASILLSTPATPFLGRRVLIGAEFFAGGVLLLLELIVPACGYNFS